MNSEDSGNGKIHNNAKQEELLKMMSDAIAIRLQLVNAREC